ncbi:IgA FC receptor [Dissostichus eleginoides]|uniref:IgA FC receptor n=1 Tax=Dissostichus eleginoides TaxID=100907 RepID=A0AAD9CQ58_DISEL|nr:IgA FC receptor [Dissostichus eleginoides]
MPQVGNSCMGVHRIACQIREPTTPDKTSLDPGQIHSTRWPMMTEPDISMQATSLQGTSSLTEQAERGDRAPASPQPPASENHFLAPRLQDTTEFPTPPPTPPERHSPEGTPPASPCFPPPPPPALASPPVAPVSQSEDPCPASEPCHPPLRYEHELCLTVS